MIIFLDIDEVLVDFVGPALALHNLTVDQVRHLWPETCWSVNRALGWSNSKFWSPIHEAGAEFWEHLPEKPWLDELLYLVSTQVGGTTDEAYLVSAPSLCPTSYEGKIGWIRNRMGHGFDKFVLTPHKHLMAGTDRLLIDDNPNNCESFEQAGGRSILFPMWGNSNRKYLDDPVLHVKEELRKICPNQF